ncbi:MAG: EAL domain-containing protein [Bryobacteraceae bacterium]|nr:EAL domain-containing protein [Bryobacteraceae bacterium]
MRTERQPPPSVQAYLEGWLRRSRSPAYLLVSAGGIVAGAGGDLERYGLEGLDEGAPAAQAVYLLEGLFPLDDSFVLFRVETPAGRFADVHLFCAEEMDCVLFLDSTQEVAERAEVEEALHRILESLQRETDNALALPRAMAVVQDIGERRRAEEALRQSQSKFQAVFENSRDAIGALSAANHALVNPAYLRMFGYTHEAELLGTPFLDVIAPEYRESVREQARRRFSTADLTAAYETKGLRRDGSIFDLDVLVSRYECDDETYTLVILRDITDRKATEAKLIHDALHDSLTDLPNRALFLDRLQQALNRLPRRRSAGLAVLFVDIDRFKLVNDSLGHHVGDYVLVTIARRLTSALRSADTVARLGGDEFVVLLEDLAASEEAFRVAERLQQELGRPVRWHDHEVFVTASIGIALAGAATSRPDELLRAADIAMYRAKRKGLARYEIFTPEMQADALSRLQLESDLHRALERGEIDVYLQPIVSVADGLVAGFEALARWRHPQRGLVLPDEFIPVAEETGLITPLGDAILRRACEWAARLPAASPVSVAVNCSVQQLNSAGFADRLGQILAETGLAPARLRLEITESGIMSNAEAGLMMLRTLRLLDVRFHLDDFGLGYSSMSYLHRFPIDGLKIHQSFIGPSEVSPEHQKIVRTILNLGRDLGMVTIAEGVETPAHLEWLRAAGCDYAQGFLIAPPLPPDDARALLAS